jgi:hypothetical protein
VKGRRGGKKGGKKKKKKEKKKKRKKEKKKKRKKEKKKKRKKRGAAKTTTPAKMMRTDENERGHLNIELSKKMKKTKNNKEEQERIVGKQGIHAFSFPVFLRNLCSIVFCFFFVDDRPWKQYHVALCSIDRSFFYIAQPSPAQP